MSDLVKFLIERLKSTRWGAEVLVIAGVVALCFATAMYFQTKPEAVTVLHDRRFETLILLLGSSWIASICWRHFRWKTLRLISMTVIALAGLLGSYLILQS